MNDKTIESNGEVALYNTHENLDKMKKEVQAKLFTSSEEVYKQAYESLIQSEKLLQEQVMQIRKDMEMVEAAKTALDEAYLAGKVQTIADVKEIVSEATVRK